MLRGVRFALRGQRIQLLHTRAQALAVRWQFAREQAEADDVDVPGTVEVLGAEAALLGEADLLVQLTTAVLVASTSQLSLCKRSSLKANSSASYSIRVPVPGVAPALA
jgi:hypothetical protein